MAIPSVTIVSFPASYFVLSEGVIMFSIRLKCETNSTLQVNEYTGEVDTYFAFEVLISSHSLAGLCIQEFKRYPEVLGTNALRV